MIRRTERSDKEDGEEKSEGQVGPESPRDELNGWPTRSSTALADEDPDQRGKIAERPPPTSRPSSQYFRKQRFSSEFPRHQSRLRGIRAKSPESFHVFDMAEVRRRRLSHLRQSWIQESSNGRNFGRATKRGSPRLCFVSRFTTCFKLTEVITPSGSSGYSIYHAGGCAQDAVGWYCLW
jgi:hypothetical protein